MKIYKSEQKKQTVKIHNIIFYFCLIFFLLKSHSMGYGFLSAACVLYIYIHISVCIGQWVCVCEREH